MTFPRCIIVMWNKDTLNIDEVSISTQAFNFLVKVGSNSTPWLFIIVYSSSHHATRRDFGVILSQELPPCFALGLLNRTIVLKTKDKS